MQVSYNGNFQVNEVVKTVDVLSADQYRAYINEFGRPAQIALLGTANTDWQKKFTELLIVQITMWLFLEGLRILFTERH